MVAAVSTALVALLCVGRETVRLDAPIYDAFLQLSEHPPLDKIVIVAIDNPSIKALGPWPWPRARHAAFLNRLAAFHPATVIYDVLFVDPDPNPAADDALARAVMAASPVFLPMTFDVPGNNGAPFRALPPIPPLARAAAGYGQTNVSFEFDGLVRRTYLSEGDRAQEWPHLMELAYRAQTGLPSETYRTSVAPAVGQIGLGLEKRRQAPIAFAGPPGSFQTLSFADVLNGAAPKIDLKGKIVLVGATADGLADRYSTPVSSGARTMSRIELQANLLDSLLTHRVIRPLDPGWIVAFSLTPLWLMLAGLRWLGPRLNMTLGVTLLLGTLVVSCEMFIHLRIWAPPAPGLIGLALVYPLWSWRRLEATSAYIRDELSRFSLERDPLPPSQEPGVNLAGEAIDRQVELLQQAISRARDVRSFVADALQGVPDPILVAGQDGRVVIANREAETMFHSLTRQHPTGANVEDLMSCFEALPDSPSTTIRRDRELMTASGEFYSVRRTPLTDANGKTAGWILRFSDISAIKVARRQQEQVLELLSHDMRSPQVSILALLDGANDVAVPNATAERIRKYARRTLALADNFVHMARADTLTHYAFETVNLGDILLEAVDDLWPQSTVRGIAVEIREEPREHLVRADRALLTRALINLVDNAIRFTGEGGRVTCSVDRRAPLGREEIVCVISDTGCGMTQDQLSSLFQRFRRPGSGAANRKDGVGLGLLLVQRVIARHGGAIACESVLGRGTSFTLTFPAWEEA